MKRMKLLFTFALPVFLLQTAQAQSTMMSRLTAKANWYNDGTAFVSQDTTKYSYSNAARGGDLTHTMKYDNAMSWNATDTSMVPSTYMLQTFDGMNNITSTTTQTYSVFAGTWSNTSKVNYFYVPTTSILGEKINQTWGSGVWANVSHDLYSYDGGHHLSNDLFGNWIGFGWDTVSQKIYFNDGTSGKVSQEIDQNYSGGVWSNVAKYDYQYDGSNWLTTYTYSVWTGSGYAPSYTYTYTYDTTGDRLTTTYQTYTGSTPLNVSLKTYAGFNAAMEPTSEIDQNWDTAGGGYYYNTKAWTFAYNGYYQLTQSVGESWNIAGFWEYAFGDPMSDYWYETYDPSTAGVATVNNANGVVSVYPNPVQNTINIKLNWNEAQAFSVTVLDMKGSVVTSWSVPATAQYATTVPVDGYADGVYVVRISGTNGQITKQVVVAH